MPNEERIVAEFLDQWFGEGFNPQDVAKEEGAVIDAVLSYVEGKFSDAKYVLGLALDFALLAQKIPDPDAKVFRKGYDKDAIFGRYTLITARGARAANTLTVEYGGSKFGIRKIEEQVIDLFVSLARPGYPSAYVYNTGQWHKFQDTLLGSCFSLSESGRYVLVRRLIAFGTAMLAPGTALGRAEPRVRLFEAVLRSYPRGHAKENAGAVFQGIAAGFMQADRPHLALIVDKTRTGSARQARLGDIDGYVGLDLEVSCEVKDYPLTGDNVVAEIGEFLSKVKGNRVMGQVFARSATAEAMEAMREAGAACMTDALMLQTVETWDWPKQDAALNGLLHFLAHVEQSPDAVGRLLAFISRCDPTHDSLTYYEASAGS